MGLGGDFCDDGAKDEACDASPRVVEAVPLRVVDDNRAGSVPTPTLRIDDKHIDRDDRKLGTRLGCQLGRESHRECASTSVAHRILPVISITFAFQTRNPKKA
jgi:hypothetical protein